MKSQQLSQEQKQKYRRVEAERAAENRIQAEAKKKKSKNVTLVEEELEDKRKNAREWKRLSGANMPIGLAKNVQARKSKTKTTRERVATRKISHQLCIVQLQVLISGCIGKVSK